MAWLRSKVRRWRARRLVNKAGVECMVSDCAAFLAGRLAVEAAGRGQIPQHWQWLNLLAHGSPEQVSQLAAEKLPSEPRTLYEAKWYAALSFLASQLLDKVDTGVATLDEIQRAILVPLELELALEGSGPGSGSRAEAPAPALLVRNVLTRLTSTQQLRQR